MKTRRNVLKLLSGWLAIAGNAFAAIPLISHSRKPQKNRWRSVVWSGWLDDGDDFVVRWKAPDGLPFRPVSYTKPSHGHEPGSSAVWIAQRSSDEQCFYCAAWAPRGAIAEEKERRKIQARERLDSFLERDR